MSRTITTQCRAYTAPWHSVKVSDLGELTNAAELLYLEADVGHQSIPKDWTLVGEATITVELVANDQAVAGAVAALRATLAEHQAEAERKTKAIQSEIQKLLALPCEVAR